jgi:hypothetical protein
MVLTNRTTSNKTGRLYGKHFKALALWVAKYEGSTIEYSIPAKRSLTQAELEASCPDFYTL